MKLILITFLSILSLTVYSKKVEGYIIKNDSSRIEVTLKIPFYSFTDIVNFLHLQKKTFQFTNGKKVKLTPEDIIEFGFAFDNKEYRMLSVWKSFGKNLKFKIKEPKKKIFLYLVSDGALKSFKYYFKGHLPTSQESGLFEEPVLKLVNQLPIRPSIDNFNQEMIKYLNCSATTELINKRSTLRDFIEDLIKVYNKECFH